ncbi:unnamed protein product, partial [Pylaiella littoralis]
GRGRGCGRKSQGGRACAGVAASVGAAGNSRARDQGRGEACGLLRHRLFLQQEGHSRPERHHVTVEAHLLRLPAVPSLRERRRDPRKSRTEAVQAARAPRLRHLPNPLRVCCGK